MNNASANVKIATDFNRANRAKPDFTISCNLRSLVTRLLVTRHLSLVTNI
jgi:hypothetical protein